MTEKRFELFVGNNYGIQTCDGEVMIDSIISVGDADVLVDWLNELHDENKQLKQKVDFYKYFQKDARELEKENEQLKKENKFLRCTIESNSQDDYIDYLEKQNERLKERITELASNDKIVFMNGQY